MEVESENAQAAWDWAIDQGRVERLDRGIEGLCRFYEWRGRWREEETACRVAADHLARTEGPAPGKAEGSVEGTHARAKALAWQGAFSWRLGRTELGGELLRQSLALLEGPEFVDQDTRSEKAFVLFEMGQVVKDSTPEEARPLYEQSLALYRSLGDRWSTAYVLEELGWLAWDSTAYGEASRLFEDSLAIRQSLEDRRGVARSLYATGGRQLGLGPVGTTS